MERDNLPSFADCFQGFHKLTHLGESHIVAASPQQYHHSSPRTQQGHQLQSARGNFTPAELRSPTGMGSMNLSPVRMTPKGQHTTNAHSGPPAMHHLAINTPGTYGVNYQNSASPTSSPRPQFGLLSTRKSPHGLSPGAVGASGDMPPPVATATAAVRNGGGKAAAADTEFSFRTMEDSIMTDEESASDPVATPPREIERDDVEFGGGSSSEDAGGGGAFGTPGHHPLRGGESGGSRGSGGERTPLHQRPPLHPNLSPILSPHGGDGAHPMMMGDAVAKGRHLWDAMSSDAAGPEGGGGGPYDGHSPHRGTTSTSPRRARTLEEIAVKHLFPLFGEFLRCLPPKRLEALLLACDPQSQEPLFEGELLQRPQNQQRCAEHELHGLKGAFQRQCNERLARDSYRSIEERVNSIIPPFDDLLGLRCEMGGSGHDGVLWSTGLRDFAYIHPRVTYHIPGTSRFSDSW